MRRTNAQHKKLIVAGVIAVFLLVGAGGLLLHKPNNPRPSVLGAATVQQQPITVLRYQGTDGKTALALLKLRATVVTKQSSYGEYVVSINGSDGGGKKYWIFYVNGQEASVGAGAYVTKSTDKIEWRLQ